MTATQDLRELEAELDATLTGWPRPRYTLMTTATGKRAEALVRAARAKFLRYAFESFSLRARLWAALREIDGLRTANELLTAELEARRGP